MTINFDSIKFTKKDLNKEISINSFNLGSINFSINNSFSPFLDGPDLKCFCLTWEVSVNSIVYIDHRYFKDIEKARIEAQLIFTHEVLNFNRSKKIKDESLNDTI